MHFVPNAWAHSTNQVVEIHKRYQYMIASTNNKPAETIWGDGEEECRRECEKERQAIIGNGNVLIGKVNPALRPYLPLSCFIPHRLFTDRTVLEQLVWSSGHIPPILITF